MDDIKKVFVDFITKNAEQLGLSENTVKSIMADCETLTENADRGIQEQKEKGAEVVNAALGKEIPNDEEGDKEEKGEVTIAVVAKPEGEAEPSAMNPMEALLNSLKKKK